jgi:hypothetical protein
MPDHPSTKLFLASFHLPDNSFPKVQFFVVSSSGFLVEVSIPFFK